MSQDGGLREAPLNIFIAHPSHLLTNHRSHGDGLTAFGFLNELAKRGHHIDVSVDRKDLTVDLPSNVVLHEHRYVAGRGLFRRIEIMLRARRLFDRLSVRNRFDVVHQMNPVFLGLSTAFAGCGVPIVLGTYISDWPTNERGALRLARYAVKWAIAYVQQSWAATLLVTTRAAARSRIALPRTFASKTRIVRHGIDVATFGTTATDPERFSRQRVLFVGNLHVKKGIVDLIDAFALVARRLPNATLTIAGDGPAAGSVRVRIASLQIEERVTLLGNVSRAALPGILEAASVLCCPSHGEPLGMVAIEAMASGLPIVSTDTGGLGELVDGEGGERIPSGNVTELARALERVLVDPSRAAAMGTHNRDRAVREFDWAAVVDELEIAYRASLRTRDRLPTVQRSQS